MTALPHLLPLLVLPGLVIFAAVRDAVTYTIPNWISLAVMLSFFPLALLAGAPGPAVAAAALVGVAALIVGMALFAPGWIGGGDAKLMAACAVWMGWPAVFSFLLWTSAAGGALAVLLLSGRALGRRYAIAGPPWVSRLMQPKNDVPYGVAIAVGALAAFPLSPLGLGLH
jgi:prepilin peptidase CpaA